MWHSSPRAFSHTHSALHPPSTPSLTHSLYLSLIGNCLSHYHYHISSLSQTLSLTATPKGGDEASKSDGWQSCDSNKHLLFLWRSTFPPGLTGPSHLGVALVCSLDSTGWALSHHFDRSGAIVITWLLIKWNIWRCTWNNFKCKLSCSSFLHLYESLAKIPHMWLVAISKTATKMSQPTD